MRDWLEIFEAVGRSVLDAVIILCVSFLIWWVAVWG